MYVSRWGSLVGGDILVDLFVQRQWHQSIPHRQSQCQRLLGDRGGLTASSAHVFLGIIKSLDRLPGRERSHKNVPLVKLQSVEFSKGTNLTISPVRNFLTRCRSSCWCCSLTNTFLVTSVICYFLTGLMSLKTRSTFQQMPNAHSLYSVHHADTHILYRLWCRVT